MTAIMEFRCGHTAIELGLDEGGTGMYVITSVQNYDNELRPACRIEECRVSDKGLALIAFRYHCRSFQRAWEEGVF